jgi:FkbM family methyltransferase
MGGARLRSGEGRRPLNLLPARLNDKPHYVFHPVRTLRRLWRTPTGMPASDAGTEVAALPWGLPLHVWPQEAIGYSILAGGIFDPGVTEAMHRLIDPGDLVVDVGANVGYLTSLALVRSGDGGTVLAYEPHPAIFGLLERNASIWRQRPRLASLELSRVALSDSRGVGHLVTGPGLDINMGLATLEGADGARDEDIVPIDLSRLDDDLGDRSVGLLKIDVEGHELQVLRGARSLLERGLVRDLIFEDHQPYPDAATELVEGAGYRLFSLGNDLVGPYLGPRVRRARVEGWPGPSYLATLDPDRALRRLAPLGWQVEGIGPRRPVAITRLEFALAKRRAWRPRRNGSP